MLSSVSLSLCLLPTEYCMPKCNKNWFLFFLFRMYFFKAQGLWIYKPHPSACVDYIFLSRRPGLVNWSSQKNPTAREKLGLLEGTFPGIVILVILFFGQYIFEACFISLIVLHLNLEDQASFLVINSPERLVPQWEEVFWHNTVNGRRKSIFHFFP